MGRNVFLMNRIRFYVPMRIQYPIFSRYFTAGVQLIFFFVCALFYHSLAFYTLLQNIQEDKIYGTAINNNLQS